MSLRMSIGMTLVAMALPLTAQQTDCGLKVSGFGTLGLALNSSDRAE